MLAGQITSHPYPATAEGGQRRNRQKPEFVNQFAPWETDESFDNSSSDYSTIIGYNTTQRGAPVAHQKNPSSPALFPEVEGYTQQAIQKNPPNVFAPNSTQKDFKREPIVTNKRVSTAQESSGRYQRPAYPAKNFLNRIQTESDQKPAIPSTTVVFNNSVRNDENIAKQSFRKPLYSRQGSQESSPLRFQERHMSEQMKDLERAFPLEQSQIVSYAKFGQQIQSIFDRKGSFNNEGFQTYKARENMNYLERLLKNKSALAGGKSYVEVADELLNPPSPTYIYIEGDIQDSLRKMTTSDIYSGNPNRTFDQRLDSPGLERKFQIPRQVSMDAKALDMDHTDYIKTTLGDDSIYGNEDMKAMRNRIIREFLPLRMSPVVVNRNKSGSNNSKTIMTADQGTRLVNNKKKAVSINVIDNKSVLYPKSVPEKDPLPFKQAERNSVPNPVIKSNHVPPMMDNYKSNKKKYYTKPAGGFSLHEIQKAEEIEEYYKQIPLLGNLKKVFELKPKAAPSSNVRTQDKAKLVARQVENPSPERGAKSNLINNKNVKIKDIPIFEKGYLNKHLLKGKLETTLRERMVSLNGISAIKMEINDERFPGQRKMNSSPFEKAFAAPRSNKLLGVTATPSFGNQQSAKGK